ncbi:MAG: tetratricopeptide repeat protein [Pirellulales bacterium]
MNDSDTNNTPNPDIVPPFSAEEPPPKPARRINLFSQVKWIVLALILMVIVSSSLQLTDVSTWYRAAAVEHLESGDKEQALESAAKAIEWSPENPALRIWYAEFFCELEEYDKAEEQINKSQELAPQSMQVLSHKSSFLLRLGKHKQALADADEVVAASREGSDVHLHQALNTRAYMIAQALEDEYEEADLEQGLKDIEEAITIVLKNASYVDTRGYLKYFNDDLDGALIDLNYSINELEAEYNTILKENEDKAIQSIYTKSEIELRKETLSVLYHHRAAVLKKQGETEAAEKEEQLSKEYGFNRMKGIW